MENFNKNLLTVLSNESYLINVQNIRELWPCQGEFKTYDFTLSNYSNIKSNGIIYQFTLADQRINLKTNSPLLLTLHICKSLEMTDLFGDTIEIYMLYSVPNKYVDLSKS